MKKRKGVTMVELLLVVAILAFLAAIIAIAASNVSQDARKKSMYGSLKNVKTAMEVYYIQNNRFPNTDGFQSVINLRTGLISASSNRLIDSMPYDSFGGTATTNLSYLRYTPAVNEKDTYVVFSVGPNGTQGITAIGNDTVTPASAATNTDDIFVTNARNEAYQQ